MNRYRKPVKVKCRDCGAEGELTSRLLHRRAQKRGMRCIPCARKAGLDALGRRKKTPPPTKEQKAAAIARASESQWWRCPKDDSRWSSNVIGDARLYGKMPTCPRCSAALEPCGLKEQR